MATSTGFISNIYWQQMKASLVDENFYDKNTISLPYMATPINLKFFVGVAFVYVDVWINDIFFVTATTDEFGQFEINPIFALYGNVVKMRMRTMDNVIVPNGETRIMYNTYNSYTPFVVLGKDLTSTGLLLDYIQKESRLYEADNDGLWDNFAPLISLTKRGGMTATEEADMIKGIFHSFQHVQYMATVEGILSSIPTVDHYIIYENGALFDVVKEGERIETSIGLIGANDYWYGVTACKTTGAQTTATTIRLDRKWFPIGYFTNNVIRWDKVNDADFYKIYRGVGTSDITLIHTTPNNDTLAYIDHNTTIEDFTNRPPTVNFSGIDVPDNLRDLFFGVERVLNWRIKRRNQVVIIIYQSTLRPFIDWDLTIIPKLISMAIPGNIIKTIIMV